MLFKCLGILGVCLSTVTFQSEDHLARVFDPLNVDEVKSRVEKSIGANTVRIQYDEALDSHKTVSLRQHGGGSLLGAKVFEGASIEVYCPEAPRVPHHLALSFKREIHGIADISELENEELFLSLRKIAEIYETIGIKGFVVAQFDTPQMGHQGRFVVEVIPHLPGFGDVKNIVDKVDCNRYVLFRSANLSPVKYDIDEKEIRAESLFWQEAFKRESLPLGEKVFDFRRECYQSEAEQVLHVHLLEILQDHGAKIDKPFDVCCKMPLHIPDKTKTVAVARCFFCDSAVIQRQLVYEYENILVFYNIRKGAKEGSNFLLLPRRHTQGIYGLTLEEINNIRIVKGALVEVLKEAHPGSEVITYVQDDPSVGQTVFHSHEQVVVVDPKSIHLSWTMLCLYPPGNVSEEEMKKVRGEFGIRMEERLQPWSVTLDCI